jgi:hypothetical protein
MLPAAGQRATITTVLLSTAQCTSSFRVVRRHTSSPSTACTAPPGPGTIDRSGSCQISNNATPDAILQFCKRVAVFNSVVFRTNEHAPLKLSPRYTVFHPVGGLAHPLACGPQINPVMRTVHKPSGHYQSVMRRCHWPGHVHSSVSQATPPGRWLSWRPPQPAASTPPQGGLCTPPGAAPSTPPAAAAQHAPLLGT